MQRMSSAGVAMILAIAVYFVLFWGFDALRILTSPTYGLDDVWRSQVIFGIGRYLGLDPAGLLKLAAAIGAMKLVVAGVCAVHILDRARSLIVGKADTEILETGLLIAVAISIVSVVPALRSENADLVREHTIQLLLAGLAAALCIIERSGRFAAPTETASGTEEAPAVPAQAGWFSPWR